MHTTMSFISLAFTFVKQDHCHITLYYYIFKSANEITNKECIC